MRLSISGKRFTPKEKEEVKILDELEENKTQICTLYKRAGKKQRELKILSQLYLRSEVEIAQFLFNCGIEDPVIKEKIKKLDGLS